MAGRKKKRLHLTNVPRQSIAEFHGLENTLYVMRVRDIVAWLRIALHEKGTPREFWHFIGFRTANYVYSKQGHTSKAITVQRARGVGKNWDSPSIRSGLVVYVYQASAPPHK